MNWLVCVITFYLAVVLEAVLRPTFGVLDSGVFPYLPLIVLVYVALQGPASAVIWVGLLAGVVTDLQGGGPLASAPAMVGPHALAYMLVAYLILRVRATVFRDSLITLAAGVFVAGLIGHLLAVILLGLRDVLMEIEGFSAADELVYRFLSLVYSAVAALLVGWLLHKTGAWWGWSSSRTRNPRSF